MWSKARALSPTKSSCLVINFASADFFYIGKFWNFICTRNINHLLNGLPASIQSTHGQLRSKRYKEQILKFWETFQQRKITLSKMAMLPSMLYRCQWRTYQMHHAHACHACIHSWHLFSSSFVCAFNTFWNASCTYTTQCICISIHNTWI